MNQEAVGKLLDTSLPTFFREVFQNSNDQRVCLEVDLEFSIDVREASPSLVELVSNRPDESPISSSDVGKKLAKFKSNQGVIIVSDRGTQGLSGSLDPGEAGPDSRFSRFFYNFGREQDDSKDGGAFGFGRGVLFLLSGCSTVFVHSRFKTPSGYQVRLMGMTADRSFAHLGRKFTGRHWWCAAVDGESQINQPFSGEEANLLASDLGFAPFGSDETGTSIMVVAPKCEDLTLLARTLQNCALVHAWPHFCDLDNAPRTKFKFSSYGETLSPPNIQTPDSPLAPFVASYLEMGREHAQKASITVSGIAKALEPYFGTRGEPNKELGVLSWQEFPSQLADNTKLEELWDCGWPKSSSIALMRQPRIIVNYLQVPSSSSKTTTAGCFLVSEGWEQVFRASENITHDEWKPSKLELPKGSPNPILQCLTKIEQLFRPTDFASTKSGSGSAVLGDDLASMFRGSGFGGLGSGDGGGGGTDGGGAGERKPKFIMLSEDLVSRDQSNWCKVVQKFRYPTLLSKKDIQVLVNVVTSEGRREDVSPEGTRTPKVSVLTVKKDSKSDGTLLEIQVEFEFPTRVEVKLLNRSNNG